MEVIAWTSSRTVRLNLVQSVTMNKFEIDFYKELKDFLHFYLTRTSIPVLIIIVDALIAANKILNVAIVQTAPNFDTILLHAHLPLVEFFFFCALADRVWTPSAAYKRDPRTNRVYHFLILLFRI